MRIVMITGMSGAGKTYALKCFEDMGYYCVDNLPPELMEPFIRLYEKSAPKDQEARIAVGLDIRGGSFFRDALETLDSLERNHYSVQILFLDADDETLIHRYQESRRIHPMADQGRSLQENLAKERAILEPVRDRAHEIVNTSHLKSAQLRDKLFAIYGVKEGKPQLLISIISFGYKYGIPPDADMVLDARFVTNPFYIPELKKLCGLDAPVSDFVLQFPETQRFLDQLTQMLRDLVPLYIREGKARLVIAIGCTGGMHRSVAIASRLGVLLEADGMPVSVEHRSLRQESARING